MKETLRPIQPRELTSTPASPRLNGGVVFMSEPGNREIPQQQPQASRGKEVFPTRPKAEAGQERIHELRKQWRDAMNEKELKNPHTRSTIELAIKAGWGPEEVTSKDKNSEKGVTARDVIENTLLEDEATRIRAIQLFQKESLTEEEQKELFQAHKQRLERVREILKKEELSKTEKMAILKAHYVGAGEAGKDGRPAGVYNYTEDQLKRKARILEREGGFKDPKDRRVLMETGLAATPIPDAGITHHDLRNIIDEINQEAVDLVDREFNPEDIGSQISRVQALIDRGVFVAPADFLQALNLIGALKRRRVEILRKEFERREQQRPDGLWQTLRSTDFALLRDRDWNGFVNKWFDALYEEAEKSGKDPAMSGGLDNVQRAFQEAETYLVSVETDLAGLGELSDIFETRVRLLSMNSAISSKSIEEIQKRSYGLRAHGLLAGTDLDEGYSGALFNRMTELLEDERLKAERGHMTPEIAHKIQKKVIDESIELARRGVGLHASRRKPDGTIDVAGIRRGVRSAYDLLIDSQRMHILASRGKPLFGPDAFFSDAGAAFKAFNPKTFVSDKWGTFTVTDQRFLREVVEKSMIDEWLEDKRKSYSDLTLNDEQRKELGDLLFKTLASPPDFFSSGWRIKGMKDQLHNYFEYKNLEAYVLRDREDPTSLSSAQWESRKRGLTDGQREEITNQAENFGLFIRLKTADEADIPKAWEKIVQYRPEEVIRLLRQKLSEEEMRGINTEIFEDYESYDKFKEQFGAALRALREQGFRGEYNDGWPEQLPEQIDFANFDHMTYRQRQALIAALGGDEVKARSIAQVYKRMQNYIEDHNIVYKKEDGDLVVKGSLIDRDCRFADVYDKTLVTDDILLAKLEKVDEIQRNFGMIPISDTYSSEYGGDGYVRNMNDLAAGHKYTDELIGFVKEIEVEEKFKHIQTAALEASNYGGRGVQAKVLRHTMIAHMEASIVPELLDALGIEKLPFRIPISEIERIYGPHAKPLSQEKRREMLDKMEVLLEGAIQNEIDDLEGQIKKIELDPDKDEEEKKNEIDIRRGKIHHAKEKGVKYKEQAERVLRVTRGDRMRLKATELFLFLMLLALGETYRGTKAVAEWKD